MVDLSKYPCPWCGVPDPIMNEMANGTSYLECRGCSRKILGGEGYEKSAADAWIKLSEKVHGKPHDGPMVEVRIAVAVDEHKIWGASGWEGAKDEEAIDEAAEFLAHGAERVVKWVTATIPVPVAQEVKGRVES